MLKPKEPELPEDYVQTTSKIFIQRISIKAIKIFFTLRLKNINVNGGEALKTVMNFFTTFASISDA